MLYNSFPYLSSPPSLPAISEENARKWLRLETGVTDADSGMIEALIETAVSSFQKGSDIKQVMEAGWEWILDCFPVDIPIEPNIHDISIQYKTQNSETAWTQLESSKFQFYKTGERSNEIVYAETLPKVVKVRVKFKLGYPQVEDIPADYLRPIRAILARDFDDRGDGISEKKTLSDKLMENYIRPVVR